MNDKKVTCPQCKGSGHVETETIGQRLCYERMKAGMSLRAVEAATGISNADISQIETGHIKQPSFDNISRLCAVYGIKTDDLV